MVRPAIIMAIVAAPVAEEKAPRKALYAVASGKAVRSRPFQVTWRVRAFVGGGWVGVDRMGSSGSMVRWLGI